MQKTLSILIIISLLFFFTSAHAQASEIIEKEIISESGKINAIAEDNEDITYRLTLKNTTDHEKLDIPIRDSMLENLPKYIEYNGNVTVNPNNISYSGNFTNGNFVLNSIPVGSKVTIEYTIHATNIPDNIITLINIVTDNGTDPNDCVENNENCASVSISTNSENLIKGRAFTTSLAELTFLILLLVSCSLYFSYVKK